MSFRNICQICEAKLEKKEDDALYYCIECDKKLNKNKRLRGLIG